jgi:hypothetical protein
LEIEKMGKNVDGESEKIIISYVCENIKIFVAIFHVISCGVNYHCEINRFSTAVKSLELFHLFNPGERELTVLEYFKIEITTSKGWKRCLMLISKAELQQTFDSINSKMESFQACVKSEELVSICLSKISRKYEYTKYLFIHVYSYPNPDRYVHFPEFMPQFSGSSTFPNCIFALENRTSTTAKTEDSKYVAWNWK